MQAKMEENEKTIEDEHVKHGQLNEKIDELKLKKEAQKEKYDEALTEYNSKKVEPISLAKKNQKLK